MFRITADWFSASELCQLLAHFGLPVLILYVAYKCSLASVLSFDPLTVSIAGRRF